ncbi:hypothetical protein B0O99DRAFT_744109 [Bisporella sp. PMI_857]|nr:hypothetical protein B0O99DRAFT_744109 [Bisporella sp. PMI_857]
MEVPKIITLLGSISEYSTQFLASSYDCMHLADYLPCAFSGFLGNLYATVFTLQQIKELLEPKGDEALKGALFKDNGLRYIYLVAMEYATTLKKAEPAVEKGCLEWRERKALQKQEIKAGFKLDGKEFARSVNATDWGVVIDEIEDDIEKLYRLQLGLFLINKVGRLPKIETLKMNHARDWIEACEKIEQAAKLVGISASGGRGNYYQDSETESGGSSSDIYIATQSRGAGASPSLLAPLPSLPSPPDPRLQHMPNSTTGNEENTTTKSPQPPPYLVEQEANAGSQPSAVMTNIVASNQLLAEPNTKQKRAPLGSQTLESCPTIATKQAGAQLPRPKAGGLGIRLKNLFRSKDFLAQGIIQTLSNGQYQLTAFVISREGRYIIPDNAFHSLVETHVWTILSQLNSGDWYKTLIALNQSTLLNPLELSINGKSYKRELLVVFESKPNHRMAMLSKPKQERPIFAIFRDIPTFSGLRPPPISHRVGTYPVAISDLSTLEQSHVGPRPHQGLAVTPQAPPTTVVSRWDPKISKYVSNASPQPTEDELQEALTIYSSFTVRRCDPTHLGLEPSWMRATITNESTELRIQPYNTRCGDVLDWQLLLTDWQYRHLACIMDRINLDEFDRRFEWIWAKVSLYNNKGEIVQSHRRKNKLDVALIRATAKRSLKAGFKPLDVYHHLMTRLPGAPGPPPGVPVTLPNKGKQGASERNGEDSGSDSDSSLISLRRRRLRKKKKNKTWYSADSDPDSETEDEDVTKIDIEVGRKDRVVQKLIDHWIV